MKSKREYLIYMAGFFDGEGAIMLASQKQANGDPYFKLQVSIGQRTSAPLEIFAEMFGGVVKQKKDGYFQWVLTSRKAEAVVRALQPFLVLKQQQALLAIEFQNRRKQGQARMVKKTKAEIRWDSTCREKMRSLNARIRPAVRNY